MDGIEVDLSLLLKQVIVTDRVGGLSCDSIQISIFDPEDKVMIPPRGNEITASIGYESELIEYQTYKVDSVSGDEKGMMIVGSSFDRQKSALKTIKSKHFKLSFADAITEVAKEQNLDCHIAPSLKKISFDKLIIQNQESDLAFLTRLCKKADAHFKFDGDKFIVLKNYEGLDAKEKPLPLSEIERENVMNYSYQLGSRESFESVIASYWDNKIGKLEEVQTSYRKPQKRLLERFSGKKEAEEACIAELEMFKTRNFYLNLSIAGDPNLKAEMLIKLSGFKTVLNGLWCIKSAVHRITPHSYQTQLELLKKK